MFWTLFEKFKKRLAGFVIRAFHHIYTRKIQVTLIEAGGHLAAFFETRNRFVPLLLLPKGIAQIFERNQMIGAQAQRLLKIRNGFGGAAFSGREQSEIVPGIGQRLGIAGIESCGTLKAFSCFDNLVLFQIHAAQAVERLGTRRIIAKRALERRAGLFVIPTLKEN